MDFIVHRRVPFTRDDDLKLKRYAKVLKKTVEEAAAIAASNYLASQGDMEDRIARARAAADAARHDRSDPRRP